MQRRFRYLLSGAVLIVCWQALLARAQGIRFQNHGWDLLPRPRSQRWTSGNTTGYREAESIPFRVDVEVSEGESFVTTVRFNSLLENGPGGAAAVRGVDFLENPLGPNNGIPDRARPVEYPNSDPSGDGPFVCWGGEVEVLEGPDPVDASSTEEELLYRLKIDVTRPVPTLENREGVVVGFAAHLAESSGCQRGRGNRSTCTTYGASFWPGSRIRVCTGQPERLNENERGRNNDRGRSKDGNGRGRNPAAGRCVPVPVTPGTGTPLKDGFVRGDINADGKQNITDPAFLLLHLFAGRPGVSCQKSADVDDNGLLEVVDAILSLEYLFLQGEPPPPPFPACGFDPTDDALACASFPPCDG